jgi:two-component system phosphate regulon sensor histidine kinase PhoR
MARAPVELKTMRRWIALAFALLCVLALAVGLRFGNWTFGGCMLALAAVAAVLEGRRQPPAAAVVQQTEIVTVSAAPPAPRLSELAPLLEALPEVAMLIDREGRVAGANSEARRQMQFEASGLRLSSIIRHPEILEAARAAAEEGVTRAVEYASGGQVEEHFRVYVAPVEWGPDSAALMVFHDQTTQILTERMRAEFLANASHELKTPVTSLSLMIETLAGPAREDAEARERFLQLMQQQADRMRRLIDDLLSLSKIELNEHNPPSDRADLALVAEEASDALLSVARKRKVTIEIALDAADLTVIGDRFQLVQVVQNLIDNAIKYSPEGGVVRVELGAASSRDEAVSEAGRRWEEASRIALLTPPPTRGGYAYLRVSDQGPGIARRHLPRLSERFFRVEREAQAISSGTGLGLAICRHIMNRHRGGLVVESQVGLGSAFAIYVTRAAGLRAAAG